MSQSHYRLVARATFSVLKQGCNTQLLANAKSICHPEMHSFEHEHDIVTNCLPPHDLYLEMAILKHANLIGYWLLPNTNLLYHSGACAMSERGAKLRKLENLRRSTPYCSQTALEQILAHIKEHGLPELSSRASMSRACEAALDGEFHYGPLQVDIQLQLKTGGKTKVPCNNLLSYLDLLYGQTSSFKDLLARRHTAFPSTWEAPWGLVLYTDELVPGNPLGPGLRKTWCIYCSFLQFSLDDLSNELAWLSLCHVRSSIIDKVKGGISQLLTEIIKTIFLGPADPRYGLLLPVQNGNSLKLYFDLSILLQDGGSHKYTWSNKGGAGLKPCLLCNVQAQEHGDEGSLLSNCCSLASLCVYSDEDILGSYDRLQSKFDTLSKKDFSLWQKAVGLTYQPCLLPLDADLRQQGLIKPASQYGHDWMHCFCSSGCMNVAIYFFFRSLAQGNILELLWYLHTKMDHAQSLECYRFTFAFC